MKKIRVLQVSCGFREGVSGGVAAVLHNYCTSPAFDKDFHFDYLAFGYQPFEPYRSEFEKRNSTLYSLGIHLHGIRRLTAIVNKFSCFLKDKEYDIIHLNTGAPTQMLAACIAARKSASNTVLIVHSHNALNRSGVRKFTYPIANTILSRYANVYLACSKKAAESMFSNKLLKKKEWIFLPNAVFAERFTVEPKIRQEYRAEFGLENAFVVGHVGRFNEQKNHEYLIRIFSELVKHNPNAKLLLVGVGNLMNDVKAQVKELGLSDKVIFTNQRSDVNNILQAMDVFVFPSRWEGLPVTVVEAQASGLKCLISDKITREVKCSDLVEYLSIEQSPAVWVEEILKNDSYANRNNKVIGTPFDILVSGNELANLYRNFLQKN